MSRLSELTDRGGAKGFTVEFFGGLVPGIAFLFGVLLALFVPLYGFLAPHLPKPGITFDGMSLSIGTLMLIVAPVGATFLVFAYIAGHLFYKQDPKHADAASYARIPRSEHADGMVGDVDGTLKVEFPYHYLRRYLDRRGLAYLSQHVPWPDTHECTPRAQYFRRTKHFANALKVRIHMEAPEQFRPISGNEAHVRLSSTMWYVSRALLAAAGVGLLFCFLTLARALINADTDFIARKWPLLVPPLAIACLAFLTKFAIEKTLHYQREREVLLILETAHWLCHTGRAPKIFDGLSDAGTSSP